MFAKRCPYLLSEVYVRTFCYKYLHTSVHLLSAKAHDKILLVSKHYFNNVTPAKLTARLNRKRFSSLIYVKENRYLKENSACQEQSISVKDFGFQCRIWTCLPPLRDVGPASVPHFICMQTFIPSPTNCHDRVQP